MKTYNNEFNLSHIVNSNTKTPLGNLVGNNYRPISAINNRNDNKNLLKNKSFKK